MSHQPDNISAGTQVVALVEIRGPNKSLVHPRGAVGMVALGPAREGNLIFQTVNGYALSQFKKLEQDLPRQGKVRWKHAVWFPRLLITGTATLREARVPVRVETHRERLLAVTLGELPWVEVDAWRKEIHREFERALAETELPERPDYEAANCFLIEARRVTPNHE